jgi:hypothetical protein
VPNVLIDAGASNMTKLLSMSKLITSAFGNFGLLLRDKSINSVTFTSQIPIVVGKKKRANDQVDAGRN